MVSGAAAKTLRALIDNFSNRPTDIETLIAGAPPVGNVPPPRFTWILFGTALYRQRKEWAWRVIKKQVREITRRDPKCRKGGRQLLNQRISGPIFACPAWEMNIDGNASYLINKVTGERIHVDVLNGPELICDGELVEYIKNAGNLNPVNKRLLELHPNGQGLYFSIECLKTSVLCYSDECDFELCNSVYHNIDAIADICTAWEDPQQRLGIACYIGDWIAALEVAHTLENSEVIAFTTTRARESRRLWQRRLRHLVKEEGLDEELLYALASAEISNLQSYLVQGFADYGTAWAALDIIDNDPTWCPEVYDLMQRNGSGSYGAWPTTQAATYLCKHNFRPLDVIEGLMRAERPDYEVAVVLALKCAPELVARALRHALRSHQSEHRLTAAAVLALLDTEWSRNELFALLEEDDGHDRTIECRMALRESRDRTVREAVETWDAAHPERDEPEVCSDRFMYKVYGGCEKVLANKMLELHDAVQHFILAQQGPDSKKRQ